MRERVAWVVAGALGLFVLAAMSGVVSGGSLEPPGPVGSTMKTLEEIPGSWSRQLGALGPDICDTPRFECVLGGFAIHDRETGLVWEQAQGFQAVAWEQAAGECANTMIGNRRGWRLPSLEELQTLVDASGPGNLSLNHPFDAEPGSNLWWTSTPSNSAPGDVHVLRFNPLEVVSLTKGMPGFRWCVRAADTGDPALALEGDPPSWYQRLSTTGTDPCNTQRFRCVMDGEAVLDRETGLVWQRDPNDSLSSWELAISWCTNVAATGDRQGWRLPSIDELTTLLVPSLATLPPNHPFVVSGFYWAATTADPENRLFAYTLKTDFPADVGASLKGNFDAKPWCVRGETIATY